MTGARQRPERPFPLVLALPLGIALLVVFTIAIATLTSIATPTAGNRWFRILSGYALPIVVYGSAGWLLGWRNRLVGPLQAMLVTTPWVAATVWTTFWGPMPRADRVPIDAAYWLFNGGYCAVMFAAVWGFSYLAVWRIRRRARARELATFD